MLPWALISPLIANLFMEEFEVKALSTFPHPPKLWLKLVDDTFVITKAEHSKQLLQHINSQDPHIQLTFEEPSQQGTLPFLDTLVTIGPNQNFHTTVYRKPTHTDQYLHWDSKHFIIQGIGSHQKALQACQFPPWALKHLQQKCISKHNNQQSNPNKKSSNTDSNSSNNNNKNITIVVPHIQGIGEKFKKVCKSKCIQVHFKGTNTLRTLLVNPKDKGNKLQKSGVIYHFKCPKINCPEAYIGESWRAFGDRIKEHLKAPSPIHQHSSSTDHPVSPDCFNIIHREAQVTSRNIKEAMFIRVNDPSLNINLGK